MVTHLRVLSESFQIYTNMTGFGWFSKIFVFLCFWTKVALALEGLKLPTTLLLKSTKEIDLKLRIPADLYFNHSCVLVLWMKVVSASVGLTHSYLEIYLTSIVWTRQTFENNFGMKHKFARYLKGSYRQSSDEHFFFKYFLNIPSLRKISPKLSGSFGCYGYEWVLR